jgi:hypothetical protein
METVIMLMIFSKKTGVGKLPVGILPKKDDRFCSKMSKGTCNVRKSCV